MASTSRRGDKRGEYAPLIGEEEEDGEGEQPIIREKPRSYVRCLVVFLLVFILLVTTAIVSVLVYVQSTVGRSKTGHYVHAAVAADSGPCSTVGRQILQDRGGSVVDAAIATLLCNGLHNPQSMGIGGGHFMNIYATPKDGTEKELMSLDSREVAALAATQDMYVNDSRASSIGGKSVAVPGEIRGYHAAWSRFGRLPWADLFAPAINMSRDGVPVSRELAEKIAADWQEIKKFPRLSAIFLDSKGFPLEEGDIVHRPDFTTTLETIAKEGAETFYNGSLAEDIISDLQKCDGIITGEDLQLYTPLWKEEVKTEIPAKDINMTTLMPPSSGPVLHFILQVMDGYNYTKLPDELDDRVLMYHRLIESFKFGFAFRTQLGDEDFVNVTEIVKNLTSRAFADDIRHRITDDKTHDIEWYEPQFAVKQEGGTSHLSIYGPDGSALAVTSTVNLEFASKCVGARTGIIFNDEMDDFSSPKIINGYDLPPSTANFIEPRKRPLSSMVPTIVFDKSGDVYQIVGGSGGSKITPATAFVSFHNLWLDMTMQEAIDTHRLHHQLDPNYIKFEEGTDEDLLQGLLAKGHELKETAMNAVVQGIYVTCKGKAKGTACIEAVSDRRKYGAPDGY